MSDNSKKPNILCIMTDQLTPFLTGAYGHKAVKTPNLDKLVEGGIRFDNAYSPCPVCTPARAAFMTGRQVSEIKCYDNASPFACDEPTFAHFLSNEGYDTILSGKMHFIGADQLHGFRKRLTTDIFASGFRCLDKVKDRENYEFCTGGQARFYTIPNLEVRPWSNDHKFDEETHFRALEYMYDRYSELKKPNSAPIKPMFLCVSYTHPHEPFFVSREYWDMYESEEIEIPEYPNNLEETYSIMDRWVNAYHQTHKYDIKNPESLYALRRAYYARVTYVDQKVGEILKALEDTGERDNTVVIFTSDHGEMLCEKGMVQKRSFYEWSARVPMIINFPDGWKKGTKISEPVSLIDLNPTILDIAGVSKEERVPVDGISLLDVIDGTKRTERVVFSEYHAQEGVLAPCFMARRGKYKYIYIHGHGSQLFDLDNDPGEWNNLSGLTEYKEVEDDLRECVLNRFDPDYISKDIESLTQKRFVVKKALSVNDTHWDYQPFFDATKMYVR